MFSSLDWLNGIKKNEMPFLTNSLIFSIIGIEKKDPLIAEKGTTYGIL